MKNILLNNKVKLFKIPKVLIEEKPRILYIKILLITLTNSDKYKKVLI